MQAKHQDKQTKEKEEKLLKLYEQQQRGRMVEGVESHGKENSTPFGFSIGGGKVRHLFQSRRRDAERKNAVLIAGRDKSYPLEPLKNHKPYARKLDRRQTFAGETGRDWPPSDQCFFGQRSCSSEGCELKSRPKNNFPHISNKSIEEFKYNRADILQQIDSFRFNEKIRGNRAVNFKQSPSIDDDCLALGRKIRNVDAAESVRIPFASPFGHRTFTKAIEEKYRNFSSGKKGETPAAAVATTTSYEKKLTKSKWTPVSLTSSPMVFQKTIIEVEASNREATSAKNGARPPGTPTFTGRTVERPSPSILAHSLLSSSNLDNCENCGRNFHSDRISKHRLICRKFKKSKRKPFDALQQRVRGTEAEKYLKQPLRNRPEQSEKHCARQIGWREKHEELIRNLREAKKAGTHLKKAVN